MTFQVSDIINKRDTFVIKFFDIIIKWVYTKTICKHKSPSLLTYSDGDTRNDGKENKKELESEKKRGLILTRLERSSLKF